MPVVRQVDELDGERVRIVVGRFGCVQPVGRVRSERVAEAADRFHRPVGVQPENRPQQVVARGERGGAGRGDLEADLAAVARRDRAVAGMQRGELRVVEHDLGAALPQRARRDAQPQLLARRIAVRPFERGVLRDAQAEIRIDELQQRHEPLLAFVALAKARAVAVERTRLRAGEHQPGEPERVGDDRLTQRAVELLDPVELQRRAAAGMQRAQLTGGAAYVEGGELGRRPRFETAQRAGRALERGPQRMTGRDDPAELRQRVAQRGRAREDDRSGLDEPVEQPRRGRALDAQTVCHPGDEVRQRRFARAQRGDALECLRPAHVDQRVVPGDRIGLVEPGNQPLRMTHLQPPGAHVDQIVRHRRQRVAQLRVAFEHVVERVQPAHVGPGPHPRGAAVAHAQRRARTALDQADPGEQSERRRARGHAQRVRQRLVRRAFLLRRLAVQPRFERGVERGRRQRDRGVRGRFAQQQRARRGERIGRGEELARDARRQRGDAAGEQHAGGHGASPSAKTYSFPPRGTCAVSAAAGPPNIASPPPYPEYTATYCLPPTR